MREVELGSIGVRTGDMASSFDGAVQPMENATRLDRSHEPMPLTDSDLMSLTTLEPHQLLLELHRRGVPQLHVQHTLVRIHEYVLLVDRSEKFIWCWEICMAFIVVLIMVLYSLSLLAWLTFN